MTIVDAYGAVGVGGYFRIDFAAIATGAARDGFVYRGDALTPGFDRIVEPPQALSVILVLADGSTAFGDCSEVCYAGAAGRDAPFDAAASQRILEHDIRPHLIDRPADRFRDGLVRLAAACGVYARAHTALRFGLSQALLHAVSVARRLTMAEIVAEEYGLAPAARPIPISASCELDDRIQLDRMILKRLDLIPHVYVTDLPRQMGETGEIFHDYMRYLAGRIPAIAGSDYRPKLHIDMSGALGRLFRGDLDTVADYIMGLSATVAPLELLVEAPTVETTQTGQIAAFRALRARLDGAPAPVRLVADEWCNTLADIRRFADAQAVDVIHIKMPDLGGVEQSIEAVLQCRRRGVGACLGGSSNETDQSARIAAQIALACRPDFMMSKPGLGGDEGYMILTNEMARTLAAIARRALTRLHHDQPAHRGRADGRPPTPAARPDPARGRDP